MSTKKSDTGDVEASAPAMLWGGRFSTGLDPVMEQFNASISFDKRLWAQDIRGSLAYAKSIQSAGIITTTEYDIIVEGLNNVHKEWQSASFRLQPGDEDIHTANERRLKELVGSEIGGKLHTGRSRNDQVATDMKLWLRDAIDELSSFLSILIETLIKRAEQEDDVILPGYTHLQRAQPVLWSHWLLSYAWMVQQDCERLASVRARLNYCPLGCGALAGNPFGIDRQALATQLGFVSGTPNSMQTVGDRDFIVEFHFWATLTSVHLSKLAEDLIIYSTKEFAFVTMSDMFSTGSSLMPQKKNADGLELIRGKTGRVVGNCTGLLVVLKGLPSTFNKDLQEDKEGMFDTFDTMKGVIQVASGIIATLTLNRKACANALSTDMLATDVAYYLVRKAMPFRDAHETAGKVVAKAEQLGCDIVDIPLQELQTISNKFSDDISSLWDYGHSVSQYTSKGGTSRQSVHQQVVDLNKWLTEYKMHLSK
ncbi:Argininosuccinate lyase [Halotydeus destructor]|nr:Argininosuccinate lyase [Halotydeus destructor]